MTAQTDTLTFNSGTYRYALTQYVATKIYSVTGISSTQNKLFTQNSDYILENNEVVWSVLSTRYTPDNNTTFVIIYEYDPVQTIIPFTDEQYGRDIKLRTDLNAVEPSSSGDLNLATLKNNFLQALRHRLLTNKGEMYANPNYGSELYKIVGKPLNDSTISLAKLYVIGAINQDPRIKDILNIDITPDYANYGIKIDIQVTTIVNREPLNIVYDYYLDQPNEIYE